MPRHIASPPLLALLGGSFNPPHAGHFRIALEVHEALAPEKTLLLPCAEPPHKSQSNLLPFALRAAMLDEITRTLPGMEVSRIESSRPGPSYTVDTLEALCAEYPGKRLAFILGGEDFPLLSTWNRWQMLPQLADLIVLPRGIGAEEEFTRTALALWPNAGPIAPPYKAVHAGFALPMGGRALYLPQPRLEISSSLIRKRWIEGRSLDFLVPPEVQRLLAKNNAAVTALWEREFTTKTETTLFFD